MHGAHNMLKSITFLGFTVVSDSVDHLNCEIIQHISAYRGSYVYGRWLACLNPHSYVVSKKDIKFRDALAGADWLIPDGTGIVLGSRVLNGGGIERVTGFDVFSETMKHMNQQGTFRVFFIGSTEDTLKTIRKNVSLDYPNVVVAGTYSPPFRRSFNNQELEEMINTINRSKVDVLWVGMTAPKQEKWIHEHLPRLEVRFVAAIGAVFDFYAGNVKRPPACIQRLGLEWLFRLVQRPVHLWRRTFISAPLFLMDVARAKLRNS